MEPQAELIKRPRTAAELLDIVDTFLSDRTIPGQEPARFWNVASAWRGPDLLADYDHKMTFTAPIRTLSLPKVAVMQTVGRLVRIGATFTHPDKIAEMLKDLTLLRAFANPCVTMASSHYRHHLRAALISLEMIGRFKWHTEPVARIPFEYGCDPGDCDDV